MAKRPNDDLFEGTTMSFGEHLEELRSALFKAVIGLVIGALLGMLVANWVVQQIQSPLKRSLEAFYADKAITTLEKQYPDGVSEGLKSFVRRYKFTFDEIYIEKGLLSRFDSPTADAKDDAKPDTSGPSSPSTDKTGTQEAGLGDKRAAEEAATGAPASPTEPPLAVEAEKEDTDLANKILQYLGYGKKPAVVERDESELLEVMQERLPTPDPNMVKARIWKPLDVKITSLSAQEVFMIWVKASLIAGLVITSPWIFYQIWNFVAAGLYPHEKNYVYLYLPFSLGLFLAGAALAFFFVFDPVLKFLFDFNKSMGIDPDPRINEWLSFVLYMPLGFGVSFQLPLVMLFLNRIGIFTIDAYLSKWRIAILTIFVISMVLTPADPISMLLMAFPLTFLYFFGVGLCRWMPRGRNPFAAAYE